MGIAMEYKTTNLRPVLNFVAILIFCATCQQLVIVDMANLYDTTFLELQLCIFLCVLAVLGTLARW